MRVTNETKSKVFKTAWKNFKSGNRFAKTFSKALKSAWKFWKEKIQSDFVSFLEIIRETEKAILAEFDIASGVRYVGTHKTSFETQKIWVPKTLVTGNSVPSWFISKALADGRL